MKCTGVSSGSKECQMGDSTTHPILSMLLTHNVWATCGYTEDFVYRGSLYQGFTVIFFGLENNRTIVITFSFAR